MKTEQATAFDRLLSDKPDLSYDDIAALRAMCNEAQRFKEEIAREDEWITRYQKTCNVVFQTADGLQCYFRGQLPQGLRLWKLPVRRDDIRIMDTTRKLEVRQDRLYEFEKFIGSPSGRTAVFREVTQPTRGLKDEKEPL